MLDSLHERVWLLNIVVVVFAMVALHLHSQHEAVSHTEKRFAGLLSGEPHAGHSYFLSVGDYGVAACEDAFKLDDNEKDGGNGHRACLEKGQQVVAESMARVSGLRPSMVLSLGDSFYFRGVKSLEDPQFQRSFEDIYDKGGLGQVPWKITIGDHDHRGNVSALILHSDISPRWRLPSPYYTFEMRAPDSGRYIHVMIADSVGLTGFVDARLREKRRFAEELTDEYAGPEAAEKQWTWLETQLRGLPHHQPALRVLVAHRPVLSNVERGRSEAERMVENRLRQLLIDSSQRAPVLFLSGHDHAMQYFVEESELVHYVGNGVGGMELHPLSKKSTPEFRWGSSLDFGFIIHEVGPGYMNLHFVEATKHQIIKTVVVPFADVPREVS